MQITDKYGRIFKDIKLMIPFIMLTVLSIQGEVNHAFKYYNTTTCKIT